jgi:hypothetical protein
MAYMAIGEGRGRTEGKKNESKERIPKIGSESHTNGTTKQERADPFFCFSLFFPNTAAQKARSNLGAS